MARYLILTVPGSAGIEAVAVCPSGKRIKSTFDSHDKARFLVEPGSVSLRVGKVGATIDMPAKDVSLYRSGHDWVVEPLSADDTDYLAWLESSPEVQWLAIQSAEPIARWAAKVGRVSDE